MEVSEPQPPLKKMETRLQKKKAAEGSLAEPSTKKAKGRGKAAEVPTVEEVIIRPEVLGRPMTTADSLLDQPEVAIAMLSSILSSIDS